MPAPFRSGFATSRAYRSRSMHSAVSIHSDDLLEREAWSLHSPQTPLTAAITIQVCRGLSRHGHSLRFCMMLEAVLCNSWGPGGYIAGRGVKKPHGWRRCLTTITGACRWIVFALRRDNFDGFEHRDKDMGKTCLIEAVGMEFIISYLSTICHLSFAFPLPILIRTRLRVYSCV